MRPPRSFRGLRETADNNPDVAGKARLSRAGRTAGKGEDGEELPRPDTLEGEDSPLGTVIDAGGREADEAESIGNSWEAKRSNEAPVVPRIGADNWIRCREGGEQSRAGGEPLSEGRRVGPEGALKSSSPSPPGDRMSLLRSSMAAEEACMMASTSATSCRCLLSRCSSASFLLLASSCSRHPFALVVSLASSDFGTKEETARLLETEGGLEEDALTA